MSETKVKRVFVDRLAFLEACETSDSAKEVAEKLGMKPGTVLARASKLRSENIPVKNFKRGATARVNAEDSYALLAKLRGCTIDEVKAAGMARTSSRETVTA